MTTTTPTQTSATEVMHHRNTRLRRAQLTAQARAAVASWEDTKRNLTAAVLVGIDTARDPHTGLTSEADLQTALVRLEQLLRAEDVRHAVVMDGIAVALDALPALDGAA